MPIISVENLTREFKVFNKEPGLKASIISLYRRPQRTVTAVDDLSFNIDKGELVAFIGPNGAGKTTTLKCLSGLLYPSSGSINILGYKPSDRKPDYLSQIGFVMGQKNQLWWDIPPQETFLLHKAIYNISDSDYKKRLNYFVKLLDLKDIISVQTKKLSLGQRMKCEFVAALLHQPKVLFLDEPTIGLDVVANLKLRHFIKTINQDLKTTIILTSHNMVDVAETCKRVLVIDKGKLFYDGSFSELLKKNAQYKFLKFHFDSSYSLSQFKKFGEIVKSGPNSITLKVPQNKHLKVASSILASYSVSDLNIEDTHLEDVIAQIYTDR